MPSTKGSTGNVGEPVRKDDMVDVLRGEEEKAEVEDQSSTRSVAPAESNVPVAGIDIAMQQALTRAQAVRETLN